MSSITHHLVRRGLEATSQHLSPASNHGDEDRRRLSGWAMLVFGVTAVVFGLIAFATQYTYGTVVAVLAVVEDPHPDIYEPVKAPDGSKKNASVVGSGDVPFKQPAPITRSLRSTILHLRTHAGPWSRFRGLGMYLCLGICRSFLTQLFTVGQASRLTNPMYSCGLVAVDVISATLELSWVHIVISQPSAKPFWRRVPGYSSWLKIAPAVALRSVASQLTFILPVQVGFGINVSPIEGGNPFSGPDYHPRTDIVRATAALILTICLTVLIELPATVTMIRVAASILPEDEEAIVPFDRTFGGKVQPAILGGTGQVGLLDAWKTFTWPSRIRLLKVLVKTFGMLIAVTATCAIFFASEAMLLGERILVKA
ncbi:hypothetical protein AJ78_03267 [Emergomyces pasteurianus Ep9510]|uniref:Uncharacterized protein n=1 Tax=Emergomyces pasteurianus Ep9510 TaxID=1447872 RepID=A0A1J9PJB3_9EURO|nr:hypothetical protein AJ78_03267 [Emergomyces pasteurianus Ep9510]